MEPRLNSSPDERHGRQTRRIASGTALALCLALAGCSTPAPASPTGTSAPQTATVSEAGPTTTPSPGPTSSPTITAIPTQHFTDTPLPPDTATPTATAYPPPAAPLSTAGPWLIFTADKYLWAMNQDGTGLTRLTDEPTCLFSIRPNGSVQNGLDIAYTTSFDGGCNSGPMGTPHPGMLKLLSMPARTVTTIVYKLSQQINDLDWSPSGSKLAFTGAIGDKGTNVFVYDTATGQATRIAVTPEDDYLMGWSADERYVIHKEWVFGGMGFSAIRGIWSSKADASGVTQLVAPTQGQWIEYADLVGWQSPTEIIVTLDDWVGNGNSPNTDIRVINIETGASTTLFSEPVLGIVYSPEHNLFLATKESTPAPNRTLVLYHVNGDRQEISGYTIKTVKWLSVYDAFMGQTPDGRTFLISPDGTVSEIPTPKWETYDSRFENDHSVIVSPDNQTWAWLNSHSNTDSSASELWVGPAKAQPSLQIATNQASNIGVWGSLYDVTWSPDSQYLMWATSKKLYVGRAPDFAPTQVWSAPTDESRIIDWHWSPDSQHLVIFTDQGVFVGSAPDFALAQAAKIIGSWDGGGVWVK